MNGSLLINALKYIFFDPYIKLRIGDFRASYFWLLVKEFSGIIHFYPSFRKLSLRAPHHQGSPDDALRAGFIKYAWKPE